MLCDLLTETDVAQKLHVSLACLRRWRLEKRGPQFVKIGQLVRYRPDELENWLRSLPTGGVQEQRRSAVSETGATRAAKAS
jgi:predicted DNA-binding transcriptional regulator AlpA